MNTEIVMLIVGVLIAEGTEIAPWVAKRLVRWSANLRYLDARRAEVRAEELEALIDSRPGKLLKLATALLFMIGASIAWAHHTVLLLRLLWGVQARQQLQPGANAFPKNEGAPKNLLVITPEDNITITMTVGTPEEAIKRAKELIRALDSATLPKPLGKLDVGPRDGSIEIGRMKYRMGPKVSG
ncbi:hypothetical protein [Nonomuraea sp. NPDC049784]|uniref:hypothetical protein n=1 Tax=Nonomuraea sp. NPDC049784 TaxID=3154361 RepID=UPI0034115FB7